jgi:hypothetical protein
LSNVKIGNLSMLVIAIGRGRRKTLVKMGKMGKREKCFMPKNDLCDVSPYYIRD